MFLSLALLRADAGSENREGGDRAAHRRLDVG